MGIFSLDELISIIITRDFKRKLEKRDKHESLLETDHNFNIGESHLDEAQFVFYE